MGNSQAKESRAPGSSSHRHSHSESSPSGNGRSPYMESSRSGRTSRPELPFLGIGPVPGRDVAQLEHRREIKQDREARRLERERIARVKERERSMKEENVDGGYVVTQGVYVGTEDFNKAVVRQLMIERRIAPFWKGLNDFSESWAEHQLMAAARGMPLPPADEIPPELEYKPSLKPSDSHENVSSETTTTILNVPIGSPTLSLTSDVSSPPTPAPGPTQSLPSISPIASGTSASTLFRGRAKTLAALATSSKASSQTDLTPREFILPHDPFVNGQSIEVHLYKDASECPICFLYYPPYLNHTRCCDQPICSECFVQIKRPDPHPPEHGQGSASPNPNPNSSSAVGNDQPVNSDGECQLVSEPASCPFCVQPEFGVTYTPPPFRRGLTYGSTNGLVRAGFPISPFSSSSSLSSIPATQTNGGRRRATSLSASDPTVITTDRVRPDWAQKLANARAQAARRSAAATALHTAAYLMNNSSGETRGFSGRRGMLRRTGGTGSGSQSPGGRIGGSSALQALAFLSERRVLVDGDGNSEEGSTTLVPARGSSRRSRIDDLEEMMMMEAIRLSLASEEERRRKEAKEARKEAKRKEKEAKKAEKAARKNGIYSSNSSFATLPLPSTSGAGRLMSSSSSITMEEAPSSMKGKGVERVTPSIEVSAPNSDTETGPSGTVRSQFPTLPDEILNFAPPLSSPSEPVRPSHLRHMSTASSGSSSLGDSVSGEHIGYETPGNGSSSTLEPLFNFRSLAEVIGDEEKPTGSAEHVENSKGWNLESANNESAQVAMDTKYDRGDLTKSYEPDREETSVQVHSATENRSTFAQKELTTNPVVLRNANESTT